MLQLPNLKTLSLSLSYLPIALATEKGRFIERQRLIQRFGEKNTRFKGDGFK